MDSKYFNLKREAQLFACIISNDEIIVSTQFKKVVEILIKN